MSSSMKMPLITLFLSFLFINSSIAGYTLEDDYNVSNFFDMFTFFTAADPTHGFVDYIDRSSAQSAGLIGNTASTIYIGTDHENITPNGRPSIRLTSNKAYNAGSLVILDLAHMPGGICGTWPAFWMFGPNWPHGGEIDIIEGVHEQTTNAMTLHTTPGCTIGSSGNFSGSIVTPNCDINAFGQSANAGCTIENHNTNSFGKGFNSIGGGVYAMEWTEESITVWFFPRSSIPGDITAGLPSPSSWGTPSAQFHGGCDIPEFFEDNNIIFDLTYCGDWAGNVWSSSSCSSLANTCIDYVRDTPSAFQNAYWSINSLRVYQYSESTPEPIPSPSASSINIGQTMSASISTLSQTMPSGTTSETDSTISQTSTTSSSSHHWSWDSSSSTTDSASFSLTFSSVGRGVAHGSTTSSFSQTTSTVSSTASTTLSAQVSTTLSPSSTVSSSTTIRLAASPSSSRNPIPIAVPTAVPTSPAEMLAKAQALADDWSTSQASNWQDRIETLEDQLEAAASQAAAVSAKLRQNQRRHLQSHKNRFTHH